MRRLAHLVLLLALASIANAATFIVNNTGDGADANPGNGVCATSGGVCTLRAAIQEANALAGTDTINFSIGSGPQTIAPASDLFAITGTTIIDATTQPGTGTTPRILIDGGHVRGVGFDVGSATVTFRDLAIGGFTTAGIRTLQTGDTITVESCYIGVGLDGFTANGNGDGIAAKINDLGGSALIIGNTTGGGNVISGNLDMGIELTDNGGSGAKLTTFTMQGTIMGLGADGMTAAPNAGGGIRTNLQFATITIGGSVAGRNIISGNGGGGFITAGFLQADVTIFSDNYVGLAQDGITPRGNDGNGAGLVARQYTVESNVVGANTGNGLVFSTCNVTSQIRGNRVGVGIDGSPQGNGGAGIVWTLLSGVVIGDPAAPNIIAFNGGAGIRVSGGDAEIDANSIHDNDGLGIDIGVAGVVDANDASDADTGSGNNIQNHPLISSALRSSGGTTFITGSIASAPSTAYRIRVYDSTSEDPSGFGEGETYLGEVTVTTNGAGNASFNFSSGSAPVGSFITATATDPTGDTSEFSNALDVSGPPQFRFSAASGVTAESGSVTLTIERINNSIGSGSVQWATVAGTATSADFTPSSGTATFASGQITRTITIPIIPDTVDEFDETFSVVLSNPSPGAEITTPSSETVTITDDDPPPSVTIADNAVAEGNAGTTPLSFNVTLSTASQKPVTVDYVTSNGTATAGSDYAAMSGTLTFNPGETSKTIAVQVIGDTISEPNETFNVTLSNPANVTIADGAAVGTINNDDGQPSITINDIAVVEGNSGTSTALFTLTLSAPTPSTVTVNWSTSAGTATAGVDYDSASGTATFAPNATTTTIGVTIHGDTLVENNETFFVDLSGPANATLADAQGSGTIADDDGTPTLSINDPAVVEGTTATFTVTLAPASALPVTVNYLTTDGTATAATDYSAASGTLTFAAGETSKLIDVSTSADAIAEAAEQFTVTLSGPSGATIGDATGVATIIDDDGPPRVTIGNATVVEGGTESFTIDLSHASASSIDVTWSTADGTATAGSDYTSAGGTLTFGPGETSKIVNVLTTGDSIVEPDETFFVQLTGATNAVITHDQGTGTITNDDGSVSVSIGDVTAFESAAFTFHVTLSAASSSAISVQWTTADGTATAGSDYTAASGNLVFAPGETDKTITIAVNSDAAFEPNETFFVNLIAATNATISDNQATGTILNDDGAPVVPSISIASASVTEGNSGTASLVFAVTLNAPTTNSVSVAYATTNGTAGASDYVAISSTLTFNPGVTTQNITVPVVGDTLVEGNETLTVMLSSPANATLGTSSAIGTIVDDDSPAVSISPASATEGSPVTFLVQLDAPPVATLTVNYSTSNGSATAGSDYTATSGTLTFNPGVTTQNIVVPTLGDTLVEGSETFTVTLSSGATAIGTIVDNDASTASIANAAAVEGNAGSTPMTFTVTLDQPPVSTVIVNYLTTDGTAAAGSDYAATSGTLTFAPGVTTQNIIVPILGDTLVEGNETFTVTLSSGPSAIGTILDDDAAPIVPTISIADVAHDEGDSGATLFTFPVMLNVAASVPVSVAWTTANGSASSGSDFVAASGTVVFAPGMTAQAISIAVNGDSEVESDETFTIQLSSPANATLARAAALGTIRNDDRRPPALTASPVRVNEEAGEAAVTLTLSSRAQNGASVRWMTHAGSATSALDFTESAGRVTFGANTSATITVPIINDTLDEPDETFTIELFDATGLTLRDDHVDVTIADDDEASPQRAIVMAVGSLRGAAGSRFGTAVQMVNLTDAPANGALVIRPAVSTDPAHDVTIPYTLGPRELRAWGDLLADNGLTGLATLDLIPAAGATPHLTVRIYDDGSGHGTTGFTLPTLTPADALLAGDTGVLIAPDDPIAMRFNIGIRTLDGGASMTVEVRDRTGATRQTVTRDYAANFFTQVPAIEFAGIALSSGDYLAIRVTKGSAILYGAAVDNLTNDPSVQVVTR